jgi:hypothetical protein
MIAIDVIPEEILEELNTFSDWFFQQDRSNFVMQRGEEPITQQEAVSIEYLRRQQGKNLEGFPVCSDGIDFNSMKGFDLEKFYPAIRNADNAIKTFLGARSCALKMYYPAGGFIDWHTNANAFGYNVLFSYSVNGDGAFLYQNPKTKEVVTIHDHPGWNMKIGLYDVDGGNPLWHAAYTHCERLTWGYILDQRGWHSLVDELGVDLTPLEEMYSGLPDFKMRHKFSSIHAS